MNIAVSSSRSPGTASNSYSRRLPGQGVVALVHYRLELDEHARRQRAGLHRISGLSALDAMLTLPENTDVPRAAISERVQRIVERLPQTVVSRDAQSMRRLARAPLRVDQVSVAVGRSWTSALHRVLEFSQYAERVLLCSSNPTDEQVLEASYCGVGLAIEQEGDTIWALKPDALVAQEHSAARWAFAEDVYALHLSSAPPVSVN